MPLFLSNNKDCPLLCPPIDQRKLYSPDEAREKYTELMNVAREGSELALPLLSVAEGDGIALAGDVITEYLTRCDAELTVYLLLPEDIKPVKLPFIEEKSRNNSTRPLPRTRSISLCSDLPLPMSDASFMDGICAEESAEEEIFSIIRRRRSESLEEYLKSRDKSFAELLFELIDRRGITDVQCYKSSNVSKKTFSKIKCDKEYRPSKATVLCFCIGLKLSMAETEALLRTAGMSLSRSYLFDSIVCYFIERGEYDVFRINEALYSYDQPLLGC